jgi:nucleotide-binding universal stress UspA family protein
MYSQILVPLDQSEFAERALVHAVELARVLGGTLHLVSVVPVGDMDAMLSAGIVVDRSAQVESAREYMKGIRKRVIADGVDAEWDVCQGDIAEELLRYCEQQDIELIVMSTHGRSGLGRWVYGSIADRVLRYATVPVLLIRASEGAGA